MGCITKKVKRQTLPDNTDKTFVVNFDVLPTQGLAALLVGAKIQGTELVSFLRKGTHAKVIYQQKGIYL